jgi:hypothetical protein
MSDRIKPSPMLRAAALLDLHCGDDQEVRALAIEMACEERRRIRKHIFAVHVTAARNKLAREHPNAQAAEIIYSEQEELKRSQWIAYGPSVNPPPSLQGTALADLWLVLSATNGRGFSERTIRAVLDDGRRA